MVLTACDSNGQGDIENQAVSNTARTSKQLSFREPTTQWIVCTLVIHTQCSICSFGDEKAEPTKKQHKTKRTTLQVTARPAFIAPQVVLHCADWDVLEAGEMAATERATENRFHLVSVNRWLGYVGECKM